MFVNFHYLLVDLHGTLLAANVDEELQPAAAARDPAAAARLEPRSLSWISRNSRISPGEPTADGAAAAAATA